MGLLDSLASAAGNLNNLSHLFSDTDGNGSIQAVDLIKQLLHQNGGDLSGLLGQLNHASGMDASQIQSLFGSGLQSAAEKLGLDGSQASNLLVKYLPQITELVKHLDSNGNGIGLDDIPNLFKNLLGK